MTAFYENTEKRRSLFCVSEIMSVFKARNVKQP